MSDPLQNILNPQGLARTAFPPASRYYGIETASFEQENGETVVYLKRRFVSPASRFSTLQEHTFTEGERLDTITHQYLGDPEQFWQICDANNVMNPDELTETVGRKIRITLPEGIPGNNDA
jgi:hypothetical protein